MNEKNYLRLIAAMVAEIHQKAEITDGVDSKLVASALWHKQDWAIRWEHEFLLESEEDPAEVDYVVDVLDLWRFIEMAYMDLDQNDRDRLSAEVPHGAGNDPKFGGFDGNEEGEFSGVARMLIERMGRWEEFKGRTLNTHSPTTRRYQAMLQAKREIDARTGSKWPQKVPVEDLISILKAPYAN